MKRFAIVVSFGIASVGLMWATSASALTITGSVGGAPNGVNRVNFDNLTLGDYLNSPQTATGPNGSLTVELLQDAQIVQGSLSGKYAAPYLSGGNGTGFGTQPDGPDTTTYLTSGKDGGGDSTISLKFDAYLLYFGLLWGSIDDYNTLEFYSDNTLVDTVTGSMVTASLKTVFPSI